MTRFEKIKNHFVENKVAYICVGLVVATAGITCLIMRPSSQPIKRGTSVFAQDGISVLGKSAKDTFGDTLAVQKTPLVTHGIHFTNTGNINGDVVNVLQREGRGHPGYLVRCLENGLTYLSQREAAQALDVNPNHISEYLRGVRDHVQGLHFERIHMYSDSQGSHAL